MNPVALEFIVGPSGSVDIVREPKDEYTSQAFYLISSGRYRVIINERALLALRAALNTPLTAQEVEEEEARAARKMGEMGEGRE